MQEIVLIKIGELFLKGTNKKDFERRLVKDIKLKIAKFGEFDIVMSQSVITVRPLKLVARLDDVLEAIKNIFGISSFSKALLCEKDIEKIKISTRDYLKDQLIVAKKFKVETRRVDKNFPKNSYEFSALLGEYLLSEFPNLTVDVHNPDVTVNIEIREKYVYIRGGAIKGIGGLPMGSCGRVISLLSGGIDSPAASFLMARRGADLLALHFISPPYTSARATEKVVSLVKKLNKYVFSIKLILVSVTEIQESIKKNCNNDYFTIILRRFMMKIAERLALENSCGAIVTGESLGQVASQTMGALRCTNAACTEIPVLRPLIGMDKDDIIKIAKKIDTFETSILPYEDCCTVFVPKHPRTRPILEDIVKEEQKIDVDGLLQKAIELKSEMIISNK